MSLVTALLTLFFPGVRHGLIFIPHFQVSELRSSSAPQLSSHLRRGSLRWGCCRFDLVQQLRQRVLDLKAPKVDYEGLTSVCPFLYIRVTLTDGT